MLLFHCRWVSFHFWGVLRNMSWNEFKSMCFSRGFVLLFTGFIISRLPCVYGLCGFVVSIIFMAGGLFLASFFQRASSPIQFLNGFIAKDLPIWVNFFLFIFELISYCVRPCVLMLRPMVNLGLGWGLTVGLFYFSCPWLWSEGVALIDYFTSYFLLMVLTLYELFVTFVQWFIIVNIVSSEAILQETPH